MVKHAVERVDEISADLAARVERSHEDYETGKSVVCNFNRLYFLAKNDAGDVIGVLNVYTAYAEVYVEDLWVDADLRNCGIGSALLAEFEQHFAGKGYDNINLVTNAFQAVPFYEKCGYMVEFVRPNKRHPKLSKTFFIKHFDDGRVSQGVLNPVG